METMQDQKQKDHQPHDISNELLWIFAVEHDRSQIANFCKGIVLFLFVSFNVLVQPCDSTNF